MKSLLLLLTLAFATTASAAEQEAAAKTPALVVETLDHGQFDLSKQRGKWVLVNFWATWCSPCLKEIPDFSEFDAVYEEHFTAPYPVRTTVGSNLANILVEIDVVAKLRD